MGSPQITVQQLATLLWIKELDNFEDGVNITLRDKYYNFIENNSVVEGIDIQAFDSYKVALIKLKLIKETDEKLEFTKAGREVLEIVSKAEQENGLEPYILERRNLPKYVDIKKFIDDNSNVSAMTLATEDNLIVTGDLQLMADGVISFSKLVDSKNAVAEGDKIVTSNISDKYLPNILIGYIHTINRDANNLTKSGYITPAVDFEHLGEVLVITDLKQQIREE